MIRLRQLGGALLALAIPLLALAEIAGEARIASQVPTEEEWDAAMAEIRAKVRPGERVAVAPAWAEPHARLRLGDDVMPLAHVARSDDERFAEVLEVSLNGARLPGLEGTSEPGAPEAVGPFVLRHHARKDVDPVLWDFVDHFRPPDATVRIGAPATDCPWSTRSRVIAGGLGGHPTLPRERFECPGGALLGAGVTVIADQDFRPRRCLWAQPSATGEKVLRFARVPLAGATRLVGHQGLYWIVERRRDGADTQLEARLDGVVIGRAPHHDGDGWSTFSFDLPPAPAGAPADRTGVVELAIRTDDPRDRHLCVEATLR